MINNAKGKYRNYCLPPDAGFARSTAGGFGAGAAILARGDCHRRCIPCDNEGAWESGWRVGNEEREVWKARKHGDLVVSRAGRGICTGVHGPRASQATGYTFFRRPPRCGAHPRALSRTLCPISNGLLQPAIQF